MCAISLGLHDSQWSRWAVTYLLETYVLLKLVAI
jgi:hypothetical protein